MSENEYYKLSDELMVRRTGAGDVMLHRCERSPHHPGEARPGLPVAVLNQSEMAGLIAWHYEGETSPDGGLIAAIVRRVRRGEMPDRIAVVALQALMRQAAARAADETLSGWVVPLEEQE